MQLTSKEQALLTVALDAYIVIKGSVAGFWAAETEEMWSELYDAVIDADIDDVGEEYDPSEDYDDEDYEIDERAFTNWLAEEQARQEAVRADRAQLDLEDAINDLKVEVDTSASKDRYNRFHDPIEQTEPESQKKVS